MLFHLRNAATRTISLSSKKMKPSPISRRMCSKKRCSALVPMRSMMAMFSAAFLVGVTLSTTGN